MPPVKQLASGYFIDGLSCIIVWIISTVNYNHAEGSVSRTRIHLSLG